MSQRLRERHIVLIVGLLAGLPVLVATLDVVTSGWTPIADNALIATSAYDVFTAHSPLLGPWSSGYSAIVGAADLPPRAAALLGAGASPPACRGTGRWRRWPG